MNESIEKELMGQVVGVEISDVKTIFGDDPQKLHFSMKCRISEVVYSSLCELCRQLF